MKLFKKSAKEIIDPIEYLHKRDGEAEDTYTVIEKTIPDVLNAICRDFADKNNCTLVALCNITGYYVSYNEVQEIKDISSRYNLIREIAITLGYKGKRGLSVFKNRRLADLFCRSAINCAKLKGRCHYFISRKRAMRAIDENRPFLLSLANGYYFDHTVAVYGYANYTSNKTGKTYTFLMLHDSWHNECRYLAWKNTGAVHITCMTELVEKQCGTWLKKQKYKDQNKELLIAHTTTKHRE